MNEADTALIAGQLTAAGYVRVATPQTADVILVNTCAIREKAEDRVWGRTSQLLAERTRNPGLVIGITGCMAEHLRDKVQTRAPYISLVAGPDSYRNIAALVDEARAGRSVIATTLSRTEVYEGLDSAVRAGDVEAQVTIQRGCDKFCTFCVVPYTRGRERGVPPREVLRHVEALAQRGVREVQLLGQTVNSYAWEGADFADLLRAVARVDGIARIRFTSPYPLDFTPKLIETMASEPKICPQVHLPVQSGANAVLARMHRGYTREAYLELVAALRTAIPDIALSTDIMVGFCGETERDHEETLSLMREVQFDTAFMFRYSDRGITHAARKMDDDIPEAVKKARLQQVIDLQDAHTRAAFERYVGTTQEVLVSGPAKRGDMMLGRTPHFFNVLIPQGPHVRKGEVVRASLERSTGRSLLAAPIT